MENSIEESNARLREEIKDLDLDVSDLDVSDIEYLISPNFITRGSVYKNSSFNQEKNDEFTNKLLDNIKKD